LYIINVDGLHRLSEFKSKHARIEVEFAIECALDILRLAKSMLLAFEWQIRNRNPFRPQRLNHGLRLIRRHYFVFESLKEDHGTRQLSGEVDRRARYINVTLFGIRSHESIEITRLKFVRFFCE